MILSIVSKRSDRKKKCFVTADVLTGKMFKPGMDLKSLVNIPPGRLRNAGSLCPLQDASGGSEGAVRLSQRSRVGRAGARSALGAGQARGRGDGRGVAALVPAGLLRAQLGVCCQREAGPCGCFPLLDLREREEGRTHGVVVVECAVCRWMSRCAQRARLGHSRSVRCRQEEHWLLASLARVEAESVSRSP